MTVEQTTEFIKQMKGRKRNQFFSNNPVERQQMRVPNTTLLIQEMTDDLFSLTKT